MGVAVVGSILLIITSVICFDARRNMWAIDSPCMMGVGEGGGVGVVPLSQEARELGGHGENIFCFCVGSVPCGCGGRQKNKLIAVFDLHLLRTSVLQ